MAKFIGRTQNTNTDAILTEVVLNSTTTTTIGMPVSRRIFYTVVNDGAQKVWLKLQAASVDNDKKGITLFKGDAWEMPVDNIYTGEISAISDSGNPSVFVTQY